MAGMRGAADVLLLIGMGIGLFLIFFDFTPAWYEGDAYSVTLHTHMYGMGNALDAAELYAGTSLDYSVYQAVYETLKQGGFGAIPEGSGEDGMAFWENSDKDIVIPSDEDVLSSIESGIAENFAKYTRTVYSFSRDYGVYFPSFDVSLEQEPGSLRVSCSSGNPMSISRVTNEFEMEEDITLKRPISLERTYDIDVSRMIDIASQENQAIFSALEEAVTTEVDSWESTTQYAPDEETLKSNISNAIASDLVLSEERNLGDYTLKSSVHDILAGRTSLENPDGSYSNEYDVSVVLRVDVISNSRAFPVYDSQSGKITIDSMRLVFLDKFSYKTSPS
jgi:hypothetical protein